jgi:hypothetical protein
MKFIHIDNYCDSSNPEKITFVNERLEYFHHYWNFLLLEKSRWIFFNHEKLESHRSLFTKINIQFTENVEWYPKRLRELVVNHPYFSGDNILVRNSTLAQRQINSFVHNFNTKISSVVVTKAHNILPNLGATCLKSRRHYLEELLPHTSKKYLMF